MLGIIKPYESILENYSRKKNLIIKIEMQGIKRKWIQLNCKIVPSNTIGKIVGCLFVGFKSMFHHSYFYNQKIDVTKEALFSKKIIF